MNTFNWLDDTFSLRLVVTLAHFLWQGAAAALIVAVCNRLLKRASAHARYSFNVAALLAMVACLPATFALVEVKPIVARTTLPVVELAAAETSMQLPMGDPTEVASPLPVTAALHVELTNSDNDEYRQEAIAAVSPLTENKETRPSSVRAWLAPVAPYLSTVYSIGVALMLIRLTTALWGGQKLRRISTPVDDESLLAMVERQAKKLGMRIAPVVAMCEQISVPLVVGVLKPMILLPATLASGLSPEQLQALITHELAHIRRYDMAVNLLLRFIEAVLFFHPAVWYVSRRISIERENAADDMVLAAGWRRANYADALVRMAELSAALRSSRITHQAAVLAASGDNASEFKRRVLRILGQRDLPKMRLTRSGFAMMLFVVISLAMTPAMLRSLEATPAETQEPNEAETSRTDLYGDPLPTGAISRLGTVRFRQQDSVKLARFLPDSESLVVVTSRSGLVYYDVPSGKLRKVVPIGIDVVSHAVSTPDGSLLAVSTGWLDTTANLVQVTTYVLNAIDGTIRTLINEPNENTYNKALAISPDGMTVCTSGGDEKIRFWDVDSSAEILTFQLPNRLDVRNICFSNDSKSVAFGGDDKAFIWNWHTETNPREISIAKNNRHRELNCLAFSPVGKWLHIGIDGDDSSILVDVLSGQVDETFTRTNKSSSYVTGISYSEDGRLFAVADYTTDINIFSVASGKLDFKLSARDNGYRKADFSPDGRWLVATDHDDAELDVFDLKTKRRIHLDKPASMSSEQILEFLSDGKTIASAGHDAQIRFWNVQSGSQVRRLEHPRPKEGVRWIRGLATSPDGRFVASASLDKTVRVWDVATGRERFRLPGSGTVGCALLFTPDSTRLLFWNGNTRVHVWDVATGKAIKEYRLRPSGTKLPGANGFSAGTRRGVFSPDGSKLAVMLESIYVFDPLTGKELAKIRLDPGYLLSVAISPDNRWLLTSQFVPTERKIVHLADGREYSTPERKHLVTLRSLSDGAIEEQFFVAGVTGPVCFSPDGTRFAVATRRDPAMVRIFETFTRQEIAIVNLPSVPWALAFSADNRRLAVGMLNKNTLIWDLQESPKKL